MTTLNPTATVATVPTKPATKAAKPAKVTSAAPAAPKEPKPADLRTIRLLSPTNPKKVGSKAAARFAKYVDGMTVADALAAGIKSIDIAWDSRRKHIELLPPA